MITSADGKGFATGSTRRKIAPKASVKINNEADRKKVVTAARAVVAEHRDVIRALEGRRICSAPLTVSTASTDHVVTDTICLARPLRRAVPK